jgi:threonine dehydrogenase-like Zn-dependent dehydrogenase
MATKVLAMAQTGPEKMELREFDMPPVPDNGAILKVEAVGICGSDVGMFRKDVKAPRILGHENVGRIHQIGKVAEAQWGLHEGDLVALEEYLACHQCEWCHRGEYRHCWYTDSHNNPDFVRYGSTTTATAPGLWGGYSQYLYMPYQAVWHRVPEGVSAAEASLHIAMSNGVQWAIVEGGVSAGKSVLIQGPGQMGAACAMASKAAGADLVIVTGLTSDADRLEVVKKLGADHVIDIEKEDVRQRVRELTGGKGVDVAIDTSSGARIETTMTSIDCLRMRGGTMVVQGNGTFENFPMGQLADHYITLKQCRGHSYAAVQRGLQIIASGRYDMHLMHTHDFKLADAAEAVAATAGAPVEGHRALHAAILPWS